jgi:ABC-type sulfate/molybdate transport systems ATPase subunit
VALLELDISVALRAYALRVGLSIDRETVALVGPSGAGKTTVLRAVAGLLRPDAGRIALGGDAWFDAGAGVHVPPERRSVGVVFQEYALFPHLTVRQNVAFGGAARAQELLDRLRIAPLAAQRPGALSGGERQRVALARALARQPAVLLLDEPLSALDAHTRAHVRDELQDLLAELRLPVLLVTHDVRDAIALADRIGVIVDGQLRQLGTAADLIDRPADAFVAAFTGSNVLEGTATPLAGGGTEVLLDTGALVHSSHDARGRVGVAVHPWEVSLLAEPPATGVNAVPGPVAALTPHGERVQVRVGALVAEIPALQLEGLGLERGDRAWATFTPDSARLVPPAAGASSPPHRPAATLSVGET